MCINNLNYIFNTQEENRIINIITIDDINKKS